MHRIMRGPPFGIVVGGFRDPESRDHFGRNSRALPALIGVRFVTMTASRMCPAGGRAA
jgi:hypothetical protein